MAKTSLKEYWNYYKRKYNNWLRHRDQSSKYDRDMAYIDYNRAGGKRKKIKMKYRNTLLKRK